MSPLDWATRPLKKYADFSGRAPRAEYWWFYLLIIIACVVAMIIDSLVGVGAFGPYGIVTLVVMAGLIVPSIAAGVRRLHDTGRTGWWMAAPLIPYGVAVAMMGPALMNPAQLGADGTAMASLGGAMILLLVGFVMAVVVFVFLVLEGTRGANKYGDDPYAGGASRAM